MKQAVFLDRDGVLNAVELDKDFYYRKTDIIILPRVIKALRLLKEKGYVLIVITNQPVIARGIATLEEVEDLHHFMNQQLEGLIDAFYVCPHHPEMHPDVPEYAKKYRVACECRKPLPGMILQAAKEFDIDLTKSLVIGDMITDVITGKSAGCKTIFIESPHSKRVIKSKNAFDINIKPDFYAKDLFAATQFLS